MKLHLDRDAFRVLIESIHEKTGYRSDVLEKDYYVVLMLEELAEKQAAGLPAYFKGLIPEIAVARKMINDSNRRRRNTLR